MSANKENDMTDDEAPLTTEQVRSGYAYDSRYGEYSDVDEADFDRWLGQVKADVWDEGMLSGYKLGSGASLRIINPYRAAPTEGASK
jgi:hypothetical protein